MIKLIASDMDGTLLNDKHDIDKETVEAIKKAEDKGIIFVISTGREYNTVKGVLEKHNIKCQCILSSGAEYRDEDGRILELINIDENNSRKILKLFDKYKLAARIFTNKGVFTSSNEKGALQEVSYRTMSFNPGLTYEEAEKKAKEDGIFMNLHYIDNLDDFFKHGIEIRKFVAFHKDVEVIRKIKKEAEELEGLDVSSSFSDNIEITNIKAQKGIILEKAASKMGINKNEVMVLGDSFNDYSMFKIFEESVAMENAIKEIKEAAKYITKSNDKLGVAIAIMHVVNNTMEDMLKK